MNALFTPAEIEAALDRPGFAIANLSDAEQRNLNESILDLMRQTQERLIALLTSARIVANLPTVLPTESCMVTRHAFEIVQEERNRLLQQLQEVRADLHLRRQKEIGEVWYWQHEGGNHLPSLTCPVVIPVAELRQLLENNTPPSMIHNWTGL